MANQSSESRLIVGWSVDTASGRQVVAEEKRIFDEIRDLVNKLPAATRSGVEAFERQFEDITHDFEQGNISLKEYAVTLRQVDQLYDEIAQSGGRASGAFDANKNFSEVSQQVALAGDFQTNLGALRGLTGAAGLTGVSTGLDVLGEGVVLLEELPRLKAAFKGLPDVIQSAADALGTSRGGLIGGMGLLGVGGAALAVILSNVDAEQKRVKESVQDYVEALETERDLRKEIAGVILSGDSGSAREQLAETYADLDLALAELNDLESKRLQSITEASVSPESTGVTQFLEGIANGIRETLYGENLGLGEATELQNSIDAFRTETVEPLEARIESLTTEGAAGIAIITELNAAERELALTRELEGATAEDVRQSITRLGEDIQIYNNQIADAEAELNQARADGNYSLAAALQLYIGQTEAQRDAAEATQFFYESTGLYITSINEMKAAEKQLADQRREALQERLEGISDTLVEQQGFYLANLKEEIEAREALNELTAEYNTTIGLIETEATAARIKNQQDGAAAILAEEQKRDSALETAKEEHDRRMLDIERKSNATIAHFTRERDARSAYIALLAKAQQLEEEEDKYAAQTKQINDAFTAQQKIIAERYQKQLDTINENARKAVALETKRYNDERAIQEKAISNAINAEMNAQRALEELRASHANSRLAREINSYGVLYENADFWLSVLENQWAGFLSNLNAAFAGERNGSVTVNVPIQGSQMTTRDIERITVRTIRANLKAAGW